MPDGIIEASRLGVRFAKNRRRNVKLRDLVIGGSRHRPPIDEFWALRDVTFIIKSGDAVGVVGRNGTGKTTLLRLIAGVLIPDEGSIVTYARVAPLLELSSGFTHDLTGRENIAVVGSLHGLGRAETADLLPRIVEFAGDQVAQFLDVPVRHYSTGMRVRLGFAIMAHLPHPVLLVDEVMAVGDRDFRQRCYRTIEAMLAEGRTLVLVSHNEGDLKRFCNRGLLIDAGRLVADGSMSDILQAYRDASSG